MIIVGPVAVANNGVIGNSNDLPWYLPEDLKRFKQLTTGQTVLMGRKTYESIVTRLGKPLPNRTNIVLTRSTEFTAPAEVKVFSSFDEAIASTEEDVFCIGGRSVFAEALVVGEKMYMTKVHKDYEGDVYFPDVDWTQWRETEREDHPDFSFLTYERH